MQTTSVVATQQEWVKILTKGMVTIPKALREQTGLREGDVARIRRVGKRLVIEPRDVVEYEIYNDEELDRMRKDDALPKNLAGQARSFWLDLP